MFDVTHIVQSGGLLIIALIVFAESGMMVGFFLPGDTLLISAGILAATGQLPLALTICVIAAAAIAGDNVGYHIGRKLGPKLFTKDDSIIFRHDYIMRAEAFYEKYGTKTMLAAHFFPIVRTFAPVTAGAGKMDYKQFVLFDAIGDIAWAVSITLIGYIFGRKVPHLADYIEYVLIGIMAVTIIPTVYHIATDKKIRARFRAWRANRAKSQVKSTEKK